jgi:erythromycin esterase
MDHESEESGPNVAELRADLSETVVPLDAVDQADTFDDLERLGKAVADADVIGMGEASHGTREFFEFKRRLFQYLVETQGVRMLGLESNFAATLDINEYVVSGDGTAREALSQDSIHDSYQVETVLDLIEWMQTFNRTRTPGNSVRFHGFDVQHSAAAATKLTEFLEGTAPALLDRVRIDLERLAEQGLPDTSDDEDVQAHIDARSSVVSTLNDAFDTRESEFVEATSRREYERARRFVWMLEQGRKQFEAIHDGRAKNGTNVRIRDSAMAAQVQWLLRHEGLDRIALWGHNAHLTRGNFGGGTTRHKQGIPSLGKNLATLSGVNYYGLGLVLGGGSVTAVYVPEGEYRAYEIESSPDTSVPDVFSRVTHPQFFLDVTGIPDDSELGTWLDSRPQQFDIVGGYEESPVNTVPSNFRSQFDGLVFISDTSPARPLSAEIDRRTPS